MRAPRRPLALFLAASLLLPGSADRIHGLSLCDGEPCVKLAADQDHRHRPPLLAPHELQRAHGGSSWLETGVRWEAFAATLSEATVRYHVAHTPMLLASMLLIPMIALVSTQGSGHQAESSKYRTFIAAQGRPEALETWQVVIRGLVIASPCLVSGYNIALLSAELPSLEAVFGGHSSLLGCVAASYCTGCVVGALAEALLVEMRGRLRVHRWLTATLYVSQALMLAAPNFSAFLLGRFLMGAASGCAFALTPLYTAEIAPKDLRGLLVSLTEWATAVGLLIGYALSAFPSMTFREHALLGLTCPLVTLLFAPLLAESPRWLAQQGKVEEARNILELYVKDADEAAETAVALGAKAGTGLASDPMRQFSRLLCDGAHRARLLWPALLMTIEETVGTEVSDDYCVRFLEEVGVPNRSLIASITVATVALKTVGLAVSGCLLDRYGRKSWLLVSLAVQTLALLVMSRAYGRGSWLEVVIAWMVYNIGYGTGVGNISLVVLAESFPDPSVRVAAMSFCYVLNRAVAAVMTGIYPLQHQLVGTANVFLLWAGCGALAILASMALMTERGGTILEHS